MANIQNLINKLSSNPRLIFLVDGCGAALSAFLLGVVLVKFEDVIGMPRQTLFYLALIAVGFAMYSFFNSIRIGKNWRTFLKIIAFANLSYCALTFGLLFYHQSELTTLGVVYFLLEIPIIVSLAIFELKIAAN